ncbi:hypothetical protein [Robiginitalea sp. IMCC43444]|uniref:hypothetical protein n=1 Tax=Robiginitalea sp. IMCC43444 TaxID=3459121 RepID=UPI004041A9B3
MSLFSDKELEPIHINNLNNLLPEKFRKETWKMSDFKGQESIYERFESFLRAKQKEYKNLLMTLNENVEERESTQIKHIQIFNIELHEAEPLGMVDIGLVERFGAQSSGDRFAAGAIGYAIETAADDAFAKSNIQEKAVNNTKYELLKKAKQIYPECNLLFKFEVDFREIGSSGNVFIYMRGTAAKGKNDALIKAVKEVDVEISKIEQSLSELKNEIQKMQEIKSKIPQNKKQMEKLLN